MRVLLDENVDWRLGRLLEPRHSVSTVAGQGWAGTRNGELLRLAEREFEAFVTLDRNLPHQQDLNRFSLAVIVIEAPSSRRSDIAPLMSEVKSILSSVRPGTVRILRP